MIYTAPENDFCGVFLFVGYAPENELVKGKVELDPQGYIITDRDQKTNIDGVYAAGDICVKISARWLPPFQMEPWRPHLWKNISDSCTGS